MHVCKPKMIPHPTGWVGFICLGVPDNIMDDSGLLELIQLIHPGSSTTADNILNGEC